MGRPLIAPRRWRDFAQTLLMGPTDVFLLGIRWLHALAAVAWVGGGLFYLLVLHSARQRSSEANDSPLVRMPSTEFGNLVDICLITLLVTGTVLSVTRLTNQSLGVPYIVVLAIKITLSLWMFWVVRNRRRQRGLPEAPPNKPTSRIKRLLVPFRGTNASVTVGIVIFLLADILQFLVERSLSEN